MFGLLKDSNCGVLKIDEFLNFYLRDSTSSERSVDEVGTDVQY